MAQRVLVPLDGSPLAESILPLVADLARASGATVRLLHVSPEPTSLTATSGRVVAFADQEAERLRAEALDYLHGLEARLGGVPTEHAVRFGEARDEILKEAEEAGADLIAVTTAGRSIVRRAVLGSVADQVFRRAAIPVLLYHPTDRLV